MQFFRTKDQRKRIIADRKHFCNNHIQMPFEFINFWDFFAIFLSTILSIDSSKIPIDNNARRLKFKEKVLFNIASEASYVHILSGQSS